MEHNLMHGVPSIAFEHFINAIGIKEEDKKRVLEWWNENKSHINIYFFPFITNYILEGCVLSSDSIAINSKIQRNDPEIFLYLALHESVHAQQEAEGRLSPYFDKVAQHDLEGFLEEYKSLEIEANDFACNSMIEMGFDSFISKNRMALKSNENLGHMIFSVIQQEIEKNNPTSFTEMVEKIIF